MLITILFVFFGIKQTNAQPLDVPPTAYLEVTEGMAYAVPFDSTDPIEPDYPNDPFIKGGCGFIQFGENCVLEYNYYYRYAGNTYHDLYISSFTFKGDDCNILEPFNEGEYNSMIELIMAHIVANCNPWGQSIIPCSEGTTYPIWRLGHPVCVSDPHWIYDYIHNWHYWGVTSCKLNYQTTICWNVVTYCWEYVDGIRILKQNIISSGVDSSMCPTELEGYSNISCHPVCAEGGWGGE